MTTSTEIKAHARAHVKELTTRTTELVGEVIAKGMVGVLEECIAMSMRIQELEAALAAAEAKLADISVAEPIAVWELEPLNPLIFTTFPEWRLRWLARQPQEETRLYALPLHRQSNRKD